jgi:CheY-like chemotaxis protein
MSRAPDQRKKILVADDDRTTRYAISKLLRSAGYTVAVAEDGASALRTIAAAQFDIVFLDVWMPGMNGLEVLSRLTAGTPRPKVIVMTSDGAPETLLRAVKDRADEYIIKPFPPKEAIELARRVLEEDVSPPIEVISAQPHWVELVIPCTRNAAERIQGFLLKLEADLPNDLRSTIGQAFRELLLNAVEWGGKFDPNHKVRIAQVRSPRILMYRIADPGAGFNFEKLSHAAIGQSPDDPIAHMAVRDQLGIRAGGFGLLMTRELADELIYNEAHNEVIFIKYLTSQLNSPARHSN